MTTREQIFQALFALASTVTWGSAQSFAYTSRRVKLWDDLPAQPALCQAEHEESSTQATRLPYLRTFKAAWLIYHTTGKDKGSAPTIVNNQILDGIQAVLAPSPSDPGWPDERLTLGGLVHHCFIDGTIFKDPGDLDDQALMVVPITLLVP